MHRRPVLPLGVKFDPTDVELILGYLGPKVRGESLAWNVIGFSDLVYKKPPWEFCTDLTAFPGDEMHYFFTALKKMKQNRVVRTVGSYGTWHASSCNEIFGGSNNNNNNNNGIIGFKRLFKFKKGVGKEMETTDWLMHEFSLPNKEINLVLCVIQEKKKEKKVEMSSAYDKYPEFDPMFFLVRDSTTSAGGNPCTSPAPADDDQALDSEEEETRPSKKMRSDTTFDDNPVSGGDPCPAPAPAHDDQALDSEEEETQPSKKMPSEHDFFGELEALLELPGSPCNGFGSDDCVLLDNLAGLRADVIGNVFGLSDLQTPSFEGDS